MNKHSEHSSYREKMIEHLFIGELLKISWQEGSCDLEIARAEVDNSGHDIIAEKGKIIRHIQLKSSYIGSKTSRHNIQIKLREKPYGCVVWIMFDEDTMELKKFRFFGSKKMDDILSFKTSKHNKGDKDGNKGERSKLRVVPESKFDKYDSIHEIYEVLFGDQNKLK